MLVKVAGHECVASHYDITLTTGVSRTVVLSCKSTVIIKATCPRGLANVSKSDREINGERRGGNG